MIVIAGVKTLEDAPIRPDEKMIGKSHNAIRVSELGGAKGDRIPKAFFVDPLLD